MTDLLTTADYRKIAGDLPLPTECVIGGAKVAARSGRTFETVNPATGAILAALPACGAEDEGKFVQKIKHGAELVGLKAGKPRLPLDAEDEARLAEVATLKAEVAAVTQPVAEPVR